MSERYTYNYLSEYFNFKNYKLLKYGVNEFTEDRIELVYTCEEFECVTKPLPNGKFQSSLQEIIIDYNYKTHKILGIYQVLSSGKIKKHSIDNVDVKPKRVLRLITKGRKSDPYPMFMPPLQITS